VAKRRTWWTREFKLAAIARMETAATMEGLAAELGINRGMLLKWRRAYEAGGAEALTFPGQRSAVANPLCPPVARRRREVPEGLAAAQQRIAELERKIGQQQLDLDFFRAALQHIEGPTAPSGAASGKASTR
jgi:transposase